MEHRHVQNARGHDLIVPLCDGVQMEIAYGTASKASELQVNELIRVRQRHCAIQCSNLASNDDLAWLEPWASG
jgi:hypothetical protein